jgi:transmembrane sensor
MHGKSPNPDVLSQAERWYARLKAPDCSASERLEFQRWRTAPEHGAAFARTEKLWGSLGQLSGRPDFEQFSQRILDETAAQPHWRWQPFAIAVSAAIVLIGSGVFIWAQHRQPPAVVYVTKPGERSIVELADGSQLVLNYATELDVRLDEKARRVMLHKGEALFTVAHDQTRPFQVVAGDGVVTALGTRFEVRSDNQHVTVTLSEGHVSLDREVDKKHIQLEPGEQVRYQVAAPELNRRTVDADVVTSWSTGRLRFRSTPLSEALEEVNRYSSTQIRIVDPTLATIPIAGTFEVGDTSSVVSALTALWPIRAQEKDGAVLLHHRE